MHNIEELRKKFHEDLQSVKDNEQLSGFWQNYLGKAGEISNLMKLMKDLPKEEKKEFGKLANDIRVWAQDKYQEKQKEIKELEMERRYAREALDVTIPSDSIEPGNLHPITLITEEMINVFAGMGFTVYETPEVEDDEHNFTKLNVPKDHPARDMQDTFYLNEDFLLRTQCTAGDVHVMEHMRPPMKALIPGKTFRSDSDATHSPMFSQMDGFVVDKHITLCDLQGMLDQFVKSMFAEDVKTRFRPSFFPFTEPSVEVDVSCFECGGKGCSLCKGTGWIEILGAGVLNKKVLEDCGIDSTQYSGLAFGIGIERIAMLKYGINNMGLLFENNEDFLKQFKA